MRGDRIPKFAPLAIALAALHASFPKRHFAPLVPSTKALRTTATSKLKLEAAESKRARRRARNLERENAR